MKYYTHLSLALLVLIAFPGCEMAATPAATPVPVVNVVPIVSVTGKLVPKDWSIVNVKTGGLVVEVPVEGGDVIEKGDVLVRFDDTDARLALRQAEANLEMAKRQAAQAKVEPRPETVAVAAAQINTAQAVISQTQAQVEQLTYSGLKAEIAAMEADIAGAESEQLGLQIQSHEMDKNRCYQIHDEEEVCIDLGDAEEQMRYALHAADTRLTAAEKQRAAIEPEHWTQVEAAQVAVDVATVQRDVAIAQWAAAQIGPRPEDIAVAEARVVEAEVAVKIAQADLDRTTVYAPMGGIVGELSVKRGEFIAPGQSLVTLGDLTTLRVETTDLDEIDVAKLSLEQDVIVTFDALPDQTFAGHIHHIASMADSGGGGVNYKVIVDVDNLDPVLRWGMTAFVDVEVE
ncbi:MAG: efflux RND transporter periplasmic adaptor subunit [Anaerolineae bacterium]|nr:efflux RND transporter periplasmic adaptor subunit [Anaerolineae bacterium]